MRATFAVATLLAAALLFSLELLVGRQLLPILGGAPGVWTTCLLFFQAALLAGYAGAHALVARLGARRALATHAAALAAAGLLALPPVLGAGWTPPPPGGGGEPLWLLGVLAVSIGAPFLALAASAPLLQAAFAATTRAAPYPLYAASNLGSLAALLAYPLLIEPRSALSAQARGWTLGYAALGLLCLACAAHTWRAAAQTSPGDPLGHAPGGAGEPPDRATVLRWGLLAFVPACLLYGATTVLSSDVAAAPLLWVVPLALYLLTFVLAYARGPRRLVPRAVLTASLPLLLAILGLGSLAGHVPGWAPAVGGLAVVFLASLLLHRDLADLAPGPAHLTRYYLAIAAGGLAAGVACALLAPLLAVSVLELPAAALLAALLVGDDPRGAPASTSAPTAGARWTRRAQLLALGAVAPTLAVSFTTRALGAQLLGALAFAPALVVLAVALPRARARAALGGALLLAIAACSLGPPPLLRARSFFGVHKVLERHEYRHYLNGTTVHGRQALDPARSREPLAYYDREAPVGEAVARWRSAWSGATPPRVGVVGLGIGGLAPYQRPGDPWTFYEIDPAVAWVASGSGLFTYLADAPGPLRVVLGDGRRSLAAERARGEPGYDLLVLDAFASDSVPVHLLTEEAMRTYLERLAPGGVLLVNVSNRFVRLQPLLAAHAQRLGLVGRGRVDVAPAALKRARREAGRADSAALALARAAQDLRFLADRPAWTPLEPSALTPWTDERVDLLAVLRWR